MLTPTSFSEPLPRGPARARRWWGGWALAVALTAALLGLATLPPFVDPAPRAALMRAFAGLCHQIPARSPHVDGVALAVCHRCYGVYWGLFLAVLLYSFLRRLEPALGRTAWFWIPLSVLPPGVDWLGGVLGLWVNTPASRLSTGAFFGLIAGLYLARALTSAAGVSASARRDRVSSRSSAVE